MKLKPCPFCGSEAEFESCITKVLVRCLMCKATIIYKYETRQSIHYLITAWNKRTTFSSGHDVDKFYKEE